MLPEHEIRLRGVRVHNLKDVDLDIPHGQTLAICGVSGSGKTSLALDTLFTEGQRRYIESFSAYARQFMEQFDKPDADEIDGIPPAVAIQATVPRGSRRTTVGTVTEAVELLSLLFAKSSELTCPDCQEPVVVSSPATVVEQLCGLAPNARIQIAFPILAQRDQHRPPEKEDWQSACADARRAGFRRAIVENATRDMHENLEDVDDASQWSQALGIADRLKISSLLEEAGRTRAHESLEAAFQFGQGNVVVLVESTASDKKDTSTTHAEGLTQRLVDGRAWQALFFTNRFQCGRCHRKFRSPEPHLFSFRHSLGACPTCEGMGDVSRYDIKKIVPNDSLTVREGAIVPWNTPAYRHELDELIALADDYDFPLDVPFQTLGEAELQLLWQGVPERSFGGLNGFFQWLDRRRYKLHLRVFANRWRSYETCPDCQGRRLNSEARCYRLMGEDMATVTERTAQVLWERASQLEQTSVTKPILKPLLARLRFLIDVGVGYLSLDRPLATLSHGEARRVALAKAVGSDLVHLLFVFDEPSRGLHAVDVERLLEQIQKLNEKNHTIVLVEHEPQIIQSVERIVEMGPGAGSLGGEIVFDGTPTEMREQADSLTGQYLAGDLGTRTRERRVKDRGRIRLTGAKGHHLQNITVDFPLGVLGVISGVSASGKSSLLMQTLAPAIQSCLDPDSTEAGLPFEEIWGWEKIDELVTIDQTALGRSSRSNAVTYVKAFDEIRKIFAATVDAKTRNFKAGYFSFNVTGGRCDQCQGEGYLTVDMQFLADVWKRCDECHGKRFKPEILAVKYRNKNIAEVLELTVESAFAFFRGEKKAQAKLKFLMDVGLGYLPLGQPTRTLSSGEAQRLKLAAHLASGSKKRTLFLMDEPTSGLHMADVRRLIDCFHALIDVGHSVFVTEHDLQMMAHADYIIDMGPGAAEAGGTIVATGTPEELVENSNSVTASYLKSVLQRMQDE